MLFCGSAPFPLPVGQLAFHPCPRCLQAFHTETAHLCPWADDRGLEEEFKAGLQMCMGLSHSGLGLCVQVDQHPRARTHTHTHMCTHIHTRAHTHVCTHMRAHTYTRVHVRTHTCVRVCTTQVRVKAGAVPRKQPVQARLVGLPWSPSLVTSQR